MKMHKECKNFRDGFCELKQIDVDPKGPSCVSFEPKNES